MMQSMKVYVVYGAMVAGGLGLGYASIDYAMNGPKVSNVNTTHDWAAGRGTMGLTHSWVIDSGKSKKR